MANNISDNIQEWLKLSNQGLFVEAKSFYFNNLFDEIIERFVDRTVGANRCDVLFSILGFTPEPIILTQRALLPSIHVIFTTGKNYASDSEIVSYLEKYLTSDYKIVNLDDDSFGTIYSSLRAQMNIYPSSNYVIDITGGKKSMVASAAIFAKDHNCDVVYVDYDEYIPTLRRPMPGTEKLNVVYSAIDNLLDTIDFTTLNDVGQDAYEAQPILLKKEVPKGSFSEHKTKKIQKKQTKSFLESNEFMELFVNAFLLFVDENMGRTKEWLPDDIFLSRKSDRSIVLKYIYTGDTITIQRAQLLAFFRNCKQMISSPHGFISGQSNRAERFNMAVYRLLDAINYELFGERL